MGNRFQVATPPLARYQTRVAGMYVPDEVRASYYRHAAWKKGKFFKSNCDTKYKKPCRASWLLYGLFQDLSTWTLDELKALKVSTGREAFDVTPLQPAWAPWLPDQEKLILPPKTPGICNVGWGEGVILCRYKLLSRKIRFIEVDVPFLFPSLSGKDILLWFTNTCHRHFSAPEANVKLLKVLCFFKSEIHHKNLYCCKTADNFPSHLESQKSRGMFENSQMNSPILVSILILSHQPRETSVPPLTQKRQVGEVSDHQSFVFLWCGETLGKPSPGDLARQRLIFRSFVCLRSTWDDDKTFQNESLP